MKTIAFIGAGAISTSLIKGLIQNEYPASRIFASNPSRAKLVPLQALGVQVTTDNKQAVMQAEAVVLAVKAQVLPAVTEELAAHLRARKPLIISLVGGTTLENLAQRIGPDISIIRAMPNLAAEVKQSPTAICANACLTAEQKRYANVIFNAIGEVFWHADESLMNAATALGGCGIAYVFLVMEALEQAGKKLGLEAKDAREMTLQVFLGAAQLVQATKNTPEALRRQVTTPKGVTERAIQHLMESKVPQHFSEALEKARDRCAELTRMLSPLNHSSALFTQHSNKVGEDKEKKDQTLRARL